MNTIDFVVPRGSLIDGKCVIELCCGDITKLQLSDTVDFLFVSCFPNDYIPTATSLIGALKRNLGVSVGLVAKNKAEDLREHFHCWVSHELSSYEHLADKKLPFKRLLCFEQASRRVAHPRKIVGQLFRALMPFTGVGDNGLSIITPLVATGNQGFNRRQMLSAILNGAIEWILAGVRIRSLKLVIYSPNPNNIRDSDKKLFDEFARIKFHWEHIFAAGEDEDSEVSSKGEVASDAQDFSNDEDDEDEFADEEKTKDVKVRETRKKEKAKPSLKETPLAPPPPAPSTLQASPAKPKPTPKKSLIDIVRKQPQPFKIALSYHPDDEKAVMRVMEAMQQQIPSEKNLVILKKELNAIVTDAFTESHTEVIEEEVDISKLRRRIPWQRRVTSLVSKCKRVLCFITGCYLDSGCCVDLFNLVLLLDRRNDKNSLVAPVYVRTVNPMPTYIAAVQFVDCRSIDNVPEKFTRNCQFFIKSMMEVEKVDHAEEPVLSSFHQKATTSPGFDVFLSYAHKDAQITAKELLQKLRSQNYSVFYDREELKTGVHWLQTIYESVVFADKIVMLLTPGYFQSAVCREEYAIGLARYYGAGKTVQFLPTATDESGDMLKDPSDTDFVPDEFQAVVYPFSKINWYKIKKTTSTTSPVIQRQRVKNLNLKNFFADARQAACLDLGLDEPKNTDEIVSAVASFNEKKTIIFLVCSNDWTHCVHFRWLLRCRIPGSIIVKTLCSEAHNNTFDGITDATVADLDKCDLIVAFVSNHLLSIEQHRHELLIALCRHRSMLVAGGKTNGCLLPIIVHQDFPPKDLFGHLLATPICLEDNFWKTKVFSKRLQFVEHISSPKASVVLPNIDPNLLHLRVALSAAVDLTLSWLNNEEIRYCQQVLHNIIKVDLQYDLGYFSTVSKRQRSCICALL